MFSRSVSFARCVGSTMGFMSSHHVCPTVSHSLTVTQKSSFHQSMVTANQFNIDEGPRTVKLRGLPYSAEKHDIINFLEGCDIVGGESNIEFGTLQDGRRNGLAWVKLASNNDLDIALSKNRGIIGSRYIEVIPVRSDDRNAFQTRSPFQNRSNMGMRQPRFEYDPEQFKDSTVVKMVGLPYDTTKQQIIEFFSGLEINADDVTLIGNRLGNAYVSFATVEDADEAMKRDKNEIGGRYIVLRKSDTANVEDHVERFSAYKERSVVSHNVSMRGLPYKATTKDIYDFFAPIVPVNVTIKVDLYNRPTGLADVTFSSHDDAVASMTKDKQEIGSRYIELVLQSQPTPTDTSE